MSNELPSPNRIKARDMMTRLPPGDRMSPTDRGTLQDALEQDLDAVIAELSAAVDGAVKALNHKT